MLDLLSLFIAPLFIFKPLAQFVILCRNETFLPKVVLISRCLLGKALCAEDLRNARSRDCIIASVIAHVKSARAWKSCKIFTFTTGIVRTSAERSPYRPVRLLSYVLPHARRIPFISHLGAYIFARRTPLRATPTSGQRIIVEWAVTSETALRNALRHAAAFFHANFTPSECTAVM